MPWQLDQLSKICETTPQEVESAIDDLLKARPELREKLVIGAYVDGQISLSKAAELLEVHPLELRERLQEMGVPVHIGVESQEAAVAEVKAYRRIVADAGGR